MPIYVEKNIDKLLKYVTFVTKFGTTPRYANAQTTSCNFGLY